jgi:hypothetical protein
MTVEEDLKTQIDADYSGTPTLTVYVFMKTDQNTTPLEPPAVSSGAVIGVIQAGTGVPLRLSQNTDLMVYEGDFLLFGKTFANVADAVANLKTVGDSLTASNLSFIQPAILGETDEGLYVANLRYKWEKITARG